MVQHARHGVLGLVLAHVRLAFEVVIVRDIQTVKEEEETSERRQRGSKIRPKLSFIHNYTCFL